MTAEEFYKLKDYPNYDKFDKKVPKFDYYDMLDFAEAYHKAEVEAIIENIQPIVDAINYVENEENSSYIISKQDKDLLNLTLELLKQ